MPSKQRIRNNKATGAGLLLLAMLLFLSVAYRLIFYQFEYDARFAPVDYGRFNYFSYFTVQSNLLIALYFLFYALSFFGVSHLRWIRNDAIGLFVTTYILITGAVYCCGIPLGFTPPFRWDTFYRSVINCVQVLHHMIVPVFAFFFWILRRDGRYLPLRLLPAIGIYPLVYSLFSIVRGAVSDPVFYAYPFFSPHFLWDLLLTGRPLQPAAAYLLMLPLLAAGIGLFIAVAAVLRLIHNKYCVERKEISEREKRKH